METVGKGPPTFSPKSKNLPNDIERTKDSKATAFRIYQNVRKDSTLAKNDFESEPRKIIDSSRDEKEILSCQQSSQVFGSKTDEKDSHGISGEVGGNQNGALEGPKIITWAEGSERRKDFRSEDVYKNVSNGGINYLEARLMNIAKNEGDVVTVKSGTAPEKSLGKQRKTPKIEVRQEDNKTVVKILIKDNPTPTEERTVEENRFEPEGNIYENGYQGPDGFSLMNSNASNAVYENCDTSHEDGLIYENSNPFVERERYYENVSMGCYENVGEDESGEQFYANVKVNAANRNRGSKKELATDANYGSLNGEDSKCNQVYKNVDFQFLKNNVVSIIGKNSTPLAQKPSEREEKDDELYENVKNDCRIYVNENLHANGEKTAAKGNETAEKIESKRRGAVDMVGKSSVVEVACQKSSAKVKVDKVETEFGGRFTLDDNSSCDQFDSGTCSDVDSLPTFVQTKKGNVVVTIKSLQNEDKTEDSKKSESGHGRAESLTSSGLGVDSEVSDDEKSNISCDSLNSSEPYAQSNSEDHGYHTPNSEDKTGSPIDRMELPNVIKANAIELKINETDDYGPDKTDIIQQVANASQKIRNLRMEKDGVYLAKLVQEPDFEEYENVHVFEKKPWYHKKKPAPPPPPSKPLVQVDRLTEDAVANDEDEEKVSLPKNLLRDIRSRSVRLSSTYPSGEKVEGVKNSVANVISNFESNISGGTTFNKSRKESSNDLKRLMVDERTYEERKKEVKSVKVNKICAMEVDTDKFYKFHLSENVENNANGGKENENEEETFAGIKDYLSREKPAAITSAKGTIRGVKNRVKAGIATFLQLHENKPYKDKDAGKVVVYTTTMGIVRETYHKCLKVKQILRTLMVKFEERDVFMSAEAQEEIRERMKCNVILVPQVFVEGQHIGDAETIERLNEIGELRTILKPYKSADACSTCKVCGGYRLLPCSVCKGSKKSIHRNHFTAEFVSLKCMNCDQVGLTKCHAC